MRVPAAGISGSTTTLREQLGRVIGADELARVLRGAFEDTLGITFAEDGLTAAEDSLKERLLDEKYGTDRWNLEGKSTPDGQGEPP
jgi:lipoate-protein ligase A